MPWSTVPGPPLAWPDALARVADAASLVCLHSAGGDTLLASAAEVRVLRGWDDLAALAGDAGPGESLPSTPGWHPRGPGWAVQLDYEFPATPGLAWRLDAYARWSADGACTLHAGDAAGHERLHAALSAPPRAIAPPALATPLTPAWTASDHATRVERIRAWIAAGDIYQANLTLPVAGRLTPGPHRDLALFLALAERSPAPYAALFRAPGRASVVSNSPECFLRQRGEAVVSEPIKGTRRRVAGAEAATRSALLASAKDNAELTMIVDLVRNDLGRVARPGSVAVLAGGSMDLPYVHHLVGRVGAVLRPGLGLADAVRAAFPAGSITGAPKIRAMQIIAALEAGPRGAYCGSFGWIGADHADLAVAIRTLTVADDAVRLHAGGGIVADSDGAAEWDEVRAKAAAMAAALGGAW